MTYVGPSTLGPNVGMGLFAGKAYRRGDRIIEYTGEVLNEQEFEARYGKEDLGKYVLRATRRCFIDARDPSKSGPARYVNDCRRCDKKDGSCPGNNLRAQVQPVSKKAFLYATKAIAAGDELFWNYGNEYWKKK